MWVIPSKRPCYGTMFPAVGRDENRNGIVFSVRRASSGDKPSIEVNYDQWDQCHDCYYYHHCFDLGLAEVVLSATLAKDPQCLEQIDEVIRLRSRTG